MFSQREGVYAAVKAFMAENGISHEDGQKVELNKDQFRTVVEMVANTIAGGEVFFSDEAKAKYPDLKAIKGYSSGLVSNWLRKDTRLNGGGKYLPKNPGSRQGQGDTQISELRKLRKTLTDAEQISAVDAHINERLTQLKATKIKTISINADLLPESLRSFVK